MSSDASSVTQDNTKSRKRKNSITFYCTQQPSGSPAPIISDINMDSYNGSGQASNGGLGQHAASSLVPDENFEVAQNFPAVIDSLKKIYTTVCLNLLSSGVCAAKINGFSSFLLGLENQTC
jgi:hypothetical protein